MRFSFLSGKRSLGIHRGVIGTFHGTITSCAKGKTSPNRSTPTALLAARRNVSNALVLSKFVGRTMPFFRDYACLLGFRSPQMLQCADKGYLIPKTLSMYQKFTILV